MDTQNPLPEDPEARIKVLLAKMDQEDRIELGKSLDQQRLAWQKAWYLRYVIGPFLAGQLFDLWRWVLDRTDEYLWGWAQQTGNGNATPPTQPQATGESNPRDALKQALSKKRDAKTGRP